MALSIKSPALMLLAFALLSPLGILLAILLDPQAGGLILLVSLGVGIAGLHRLGRSGPQRG